MKKILLLLIIPVLYFGQDLCEGVTVEINIVNEIESEVYSDVKAYTNTEEELAFSAAPTSYDEVFEDDDG